MIQFLSFMQTFGINWVLTSKYPKAETPGRFWIMSVVKKEIFRNKNYATHWLMLC
jgi:hypothetical protein